MRKKMLLMAPAVFLGLCFSCNNESNKTESDEKLDAPAVSAETKSEMPVAVDSATMMKNWTEYMTPSQPHELMASWDGNWDADITMWYAPGTPPETTKGKTVNKMVMGNRYQVTNHTGIMMGQPFEGMGTLAYDNAKKVFISTWIDNMGTGIMKLEGPWDEATKTMTLVGKVVDPGAGNGKEMDVRETFRAVDDNNQVMEMFGPGPDGNEFKMMEIKFTRKK